MRILHVIAGLGSGGAERIVMEWYRRIDRGRFQFDFLIRSDENIYAEEIKRLGGQVFRAPEFPQKAVGNYAYTRRLLETKNYKIIHVHGNALIYIYPLMIGCRNSLTCTIMHSHNTSTASPLYYPVHWFNRHRIDRLSAVRLACSDEAGKWMFGKNGDYIVVQNGIEIEKFRFQEDIRTAYRKKLGVEDQFVVGNVARFLPSKNHLFLLQIFREILKLEPDSLLLLAGEGKEQKKTERKAKQLGIMSKVRFLGVRKDISGLMQAMDAFVFPSRFEGLGIVLIEAQFAGLHCIASDTIPRESQVSGLIDYLSIQEPPEIWAKKIVSFRNQKRNSDYLSEMNYEYDLKHVVAKLQKIYQAATPGNEKGRKNE